jgi:FkbH-like protein
MVGVERLVTTDRDYLKALLRERNPELWQALQQLSAESSAFDEIFFCSTLRKKAKALGLHDEVTAQPEKVRLALIGGYSLFPLHDLVEHFLEVQGVSCELLIGSYDNYAAEIMDEGSVLYTFKPQIVVFLPSEIRCTYSGRLTDSRETQQKEVNEVSSHILGMCELLHERTQAEILLCNFRLPSRFDLGPYRNRVLGSDWAFRKLVNLEMGLNSPSFVHICDIEFLEHRRGALNAQDDRAWFESKQPCSADMLVDLAKEITHIVTSLRKAPKKVLVVDLDNTLWGGVVGDDGLEGIEIGDTSPRGEAFKAFQKYILSLTNRGLLLGVCSKNDLDKAVEPFLKHPEMVLRSEHFASFKANWDPKVDNIRQMAVELGLGLDSFVFVDDNPAEIEIVRQFAPQVTTILLGPDPADYVRQLQDSRLFEPRTITAEDAERTGQYRQESQRKALLTSSTDLASYLASLEMVGSFTEFTHVDAPRISQLVNKSNQFNLTTIRRSEAEIESLIDDPNHVCFSLRLSDRFGNHGLISVVICKVIPVREKQLLDIDTWVMSCRVLNRQAEEEVVNEIMRWAMLRSCTHVTGSYLPTTKNGMVRTLYSRLGFSLVDERPDRFVYEQEVKRFKAFETKIEITRRTNESKRSDNATPGSV